MKVFGYFFKEIGTSSMPFHFIALIFVVLLVSLFALSVQVYKTYQNIQSIQSQTFKLQYLSGQIIYLDEVLTMSTKMAAETANPLWEKRYLKHVTRLDEVLAETKEIAGKVYVDRALQTEAANNRLVELETEAFSLINNGNAQAARAILNGIEYQENKFEYSRGMEQLIEDLNKKNEAELKDSEHAILLAMIQVIIGIPVLILVWVTINNVLKRYDDYKEKSRHELLRMKDRAEKANIQKSKFLANMSHELRTPMHAISDFTNLAIKKNSQDSVTRYLDNIKTSAARLTSLLNNLLDLAKLEAGKLDLNYGQHNSVKKSLKCMRGLSGLKM